MKKLVYLCLAITSLAGCATVEKLHNKLADASLLKYQLANGKTVYVDINVVPTAAWQCSEVGTPIQKNWAWLKTVSQFQASSPENFFTEKAIDSANHHQINPNYINLTIPETTTDNGIILGSMHQKAIATYYVCKKINPDHQLGGEKSTNVIIK